MSVRLYWNPIMCSLPRCENAKCPEDLLVWKDQGYVCVEHFKQLMEEEKKKQ